jgi:formylglycine-generating enzyme required for sulfatase activity
MQVEEYLVRPMKSLFLRLTFLIVLLADAGCALFRPATEKLPAVGAPGTVYIRDSLHMDEHEVSNQQWGYYLRSLKQDSGWAAYAAALPDTTLWRQHYQYLPDARTADLYTAHYLRYPGFRYYPVVGVSVAQAETYCRWRSAKEMEWLRTSPERGARRLRRQRQGYDVQLIYRLPTTAEWELGATGGLDPAQHPYGYEHPPQKVRKWQRVQGKPDCYNAAEIPAGTTFYYNDANVWETLYYQPGPGQPPVYVRCGSVPGTHDIVIGDFTGVGGYLVTTYIYDHAPNGYGLYNMIGNVAELTTTPGEARGGSFEHPMAACRPDRSQRYDGPQEWLGFRCACTIRVRRKAAP